MTSLRKRDDLESGWLYRVVARTPDGEWEHTNFARYGKPRTYMTLGAARSMCTRMRSEYRSRTYRSAYVLEFAVQRSPVTEWEIVPDKD